MILNKEKVLIFFKKITILFNLIVKKIYIFLENTNFFHTDWDEMVEILKNSDNILKFDFIWIGKDSVVSFGIKSKNYFHEDANII